LGPKEIDAKPQRSLFWLGHCVPFNMTGQPAASLPVGFASNGLPVGLQLVARRFDEATLFRLAAAYEQEFPWTNLRPPVASSQPAD
jgi:aspartyl-tRNA(Asn)/glutamyl-tRNA(Gln) amidotransferase subunit A